MYVFISIVLIAELIIAGTIILSINKLDKRVLALNEQVEIHGQKIIEALKNARKNTEKTVNSLKMAWEILQRKKERYLLILIKNIIVMTVLLMSKGKRKKILSAIELGFSIRDFLACK